MAPNNKKRQVPTASNNRARYKFMQEKEQASADREKGQNSRFKDLLHNMLRQQSEDLP